MANDRIEKRIELKALLSRVWRALTDYRDSANGSASSWMALSSPAKSHKAKLPTRGYEHVSWEALVEKMEPQRLFSFRWPHPRSFEKSDTPPDSGAPTTLVEFRLEKTATGTLLVITESGFDKLPNDRRLEEFRRNDGGWAEQMKNMENHVAQRS